MGFVCCRDVGGGFWCWMWGVGEISLIVEVGFGSVIVWCFWCRYEERLGLFRKVRKLSRCWDQS
jgi:hypothetical protein